MKVRVPLIYASFLVELKNFCMFEETTIEEREIVSSISLIRVEII
jgi:hypothetical protein